MRLNITIFICLLMAATLPLQATAAQKLQKITVTDTNNFQLGREYTGLNLPDSIQTPLLAGLRGYYQLDKPGTDDLQDIVKIAKWVHLRWSHDPFGSAAPKTDALTLLKTVPPGAGFSCNEYSKVLRDILRANGFIARSVTLQSKDISYGGLGSSHVAVEVFHNQLNKWILVDAQWGFYPSHQGKPINAYEVHELKQANRFDDIIFVSFGKVDQNKVQQDRQEYKNFLAGYFGYVTVELLVDKDRVNVIHALEGNEWPLTFQALPRNAQIFSSRTRDLYFDVNRVSLVLRYKPDSQRLQKLQLDLNSEQDYLDKMPEFAAVPDFIVTPHNNMPWFSHYEYRIDNGKWQKLIEESFGWDAARASTQLEVRAVNNANRPGPTTFIKIKYE